MTTLLRLLWIIPIGIVLALVSGGTIAVGDTYATSTFLSFQTYNVVAFLYLTMTILLTLLVRWLERRMPQNMK